MKAKITKEVHSITGNVTKCESLYNFPSFKEAQKRLQSIANLCRYPVTVISKNEFRANKYGNIYIFKVEKQ